MTVGGGLGGGSSLAGSFGRKMRTTSDVSESAMASLNASKRKSTTGSPLTSINSSPTCSRSCAGPCSSTDSTSLALPAPPLLVREKREGGKKTPMTHGASRRHFSPMRNPKELSTVLRLIVSVFCTPSFGPARTHHRGW